MVIGDNSIRYSIYDKLYELSNKASRIKSDNKLRHILNNHDINLVDENTILLYSQQNKTI